MHNHPLPVLPSPPSPPRSQEKKGVTNTFCVCAANKAEEGTTASQWATAVRVVAAAVKPRLKSSRARLAMWSVSTSSSTLGVAAMVRAWSMCSPPRPSPKVRTAAAAAVAVGRGQGKGVSLPCRSIRQAGKACQSFHKKHTFITSSSIIPHSPSSSHRPLRGDPPDLDRQAPGHQQEPPHQMRRVLRVPRHLPLVPLLHLHVVQKAAPEGDDLGQSLA